MAITWSPITWSRSATGSPGFARSKTTASSSAWTSARPISTARGCWTLLRRAKKTLCEKYGVTLTEPVIVEIFPQRKEFAVRTFGLPGADGLLGVCFGRVVTANSPASQGEHPANWEAVLWHEFCHVVTLSKTHNKMPRWLSEGISVHEEGREDPAWGTALSPRSGR